MVLTLLLLVSLISLHMYLLDGLQAAGCSSWYLNTTHAPGAPCKHASFSCMRAAMILGAWTP
jgi:hypothetical protein